MRACARRRGPRSSSPPALVRIGALALDARLHGAGADASGAHDVYRSGLALALVALVARAVLARNARVAPGRVQTTE